MSYVARVVFNETNPGTGLPETDFRREVRWTLDMHAFVRDETIIKELTRLKAIEARVASMERCLTQTYGDGFEELLQQ